MYDPLRHKRGDMDILTRKILMNKQNIHAKNYKVHQFKRTQAKATIERRTVWLHVVEKTMSKAAQSLQYRKIMNKQ